MLSENSPRPLPKGTPRGSTFSATARVWSGSADATLRACQDVEVTAGAPKALSAFSGLGGLDLGLEAAGFEILGCIEQDAVARRSLKRNRDGWTVLDPPAIEEVAQALTPADLQLEPRDLTLLCGAPPCQPYSKAAMWNDQAWSGFADERAKPLLSFLRLAETFLPRVVLMENVQGFVAGPHSVAARIASEFDAINQRCSTSYKVSTAILDAADFGVPQRRRRAIIAAFRDGEEMIWPEPTHSDAPIRAWDALHDVKVTEPAPAIGKWSALLPSIPEGSNYLWHTSHGEGKPLFGYRTRYWSFLLKLAKDQPSWTLPAQPGPSAGPFHWDNRPLAPEEALRLQSFPSDWCAEGTRREQIRQIGNATPPLLAEVIGRAIRTTLGIATTSEPLVLRISRKKTIPAASPVADVPDRFLDLVGDHPDHPGTGAGPKPRSN